MAKGVGGRPREGEELKRVPLSFRTTPGVRDKLDASAAQSGRSLAQEVEYRLQQSLWAELIFNDAKTFRVLQMLVNAIQAVENRSMRTLDDTPESWTENAVTGAAAVAACERILAAFAAGTGKSDQEKKAAKWGREWAGAMVDNVERAKAERDGEADG